MVKYGLPLLAALALSFSIFSVLKNRPVKASVAPPSPPPAAVYRSEVGAVGLVEPKSENISISLPVPGLVTAVYVQAGDDVKKGQPLFSLDDRDLRAELALRKANLELSRARLAKLEVSPRPEEIPPAEARVAEALALLEDAKVQLQLIESVRDKRAIREEDLLRRRRAVQAAEARLQEAQSALALLRAGTWRPDLEIARNEVKQAEQQVARVEADLSRLVVTAPVNGRILQSKIRAGEYAAAGPLATPLMILGQVDQLHVRADVDEKDAWRVKAGAKAVATVRGNAARKYPLEFVRFEPYVVPKKNLTGDATERVDTRVLQVIYALKKDASVYAGQQMDVFIEASGGAQ
jgi:multidrug resistance efflux pump